MICLITRRGVFLMAKGHVRDSLDRRDGRSSGPSLVGRMGRGR